MKHAMYEQLRKDYNTHIFHSLSRHGCLLHACTNDKYFYVPSPFLSDARHQEALDDYCL